MSADLWCERSVNTDQDVYAAGICRRFRCRSIRAGTDIGVTLCLRGGLAMAGDHYQPNLGFMGLTNAQEKARHKQHMQWHGHKQ